MLRRRRVRVTAEDPRDYAHAVSAHASSLKKKKESMRREALALLLTLQMDAGFRDFLGQPA